MDYDRCPERAREYVWDAAGYTQQGDNQKKRRIQKQFCRGGIDCQGIDGMPKDKCRCADSDISGDSVFAPGNSVVGDDDSAEESLFEQRWKNKKAERQNDGHWMVDNAYWEQSGVEADD